MAITKAPRPSALRPTFFRGAPAFPALEERMRQLFEQPFSVFDTAPFNQVIGWLPAIDVTEDAQQLVITAELPGLARKDVTVNVEGDMLTIKGEKTDERKTENKEQDYRIEEREYGAFQRAFTLPPGVDASKITAGMKDGVLTVTLPKAAGSKATGRAIEITG